MRKVVECLYRCPHCGYEFYEEWPASKIPPKSDCLRCYKRADYVKKRHMLVEKE